MGEVYRLRFTGNVGFRYVLPTRQAGEFVVSGNYYYNDGYFAGGANILRQKPYHLLSGSIMWTPESSDLTVTIWGRNLLNEAYAPYLAESTFISGQILAPPRTFGVSVTLDF